MWQKQYESHVKTIVGVVPTPVIDGSPKPVLTNTIIVVHNRYDSTDDASPSNTSASSMVRQNGHRERLLHLWCRRSVAFETSVWISPRFEDERLPIRLALPWVSVFREMGLRRGSLLDSSPSSLQ